MVGEQLKTRALIMFDGNSRGVFYGIRRLDGQGMGLGQDRPPFDRLREMGRLAGTYHGNIPIDFVEIDGNWPIAWEDVDLSGYAVVGLCLHGRSQWGNFVQLIEACRASGIVALGVADSTYYSTAHVVPEISGLVRCSSAELLSVIDSVL